MVEICNWPIFAPSGHNIDQKFLHIQKTVNFAQWNAYPFIFFKNNFSKNILFFYVRHLLKSEVKEFIKLF